MPDFQKMHEDWEVKQRELREANRKPATKPVAFSLSASVHALISLRMQLTFTEQAEGEEEAKQHREGRC